MDRTGTGPLQQASWMERRGLHWERPQAAGLEYRQVATEATDICHVHCGAGYVALGGDAGLGHLSHPRPP